MRTPVRPARKLDLPAHPRFKGFEAFAAREIFPHIAEKEAERRRVVGRAKVIAIATALIVVGLLVLAYFELIGVAGLIGFGIASVLAGIFAAVWPLTTFASSFNEFLVAKTCEHLRLRHTGANPTLPFERFLEAGLLPGHSKRKFEDGAECAGPDLRFSSAEAILSESRTDSDGKDEDYTVWRGLLMEVPAPRRFEGRTVVMSERGAVERLPSTGAPERIALGLGELEQGLEIRTTNPAEARAVLTMRLMRRLAELARRLGREPPALGLIDGGVLLAIESDRDRFQGGSILKPIDLAEHLDRIVADFALLFELAEALRDTLGRRA